MNKFEDDYVSRTTVSTDPKVIRRKLLDYSYLSESHIKKFVYSLVEQSGLLQKLKLVTDHRFRQDCLVINLSTVNLINSRVKIKSLRDLFMHFFATEQPIYVILEMQGYEAEVAKRIDIILNSPETVVMDLFIV